jgi:hypothetical protein
MGHNQGIYRARHADAISSSQVARLARTKSGGMRVYSLRRTDAEIHDAYGRAASDAVFGRNNHPESTYEAGVASAILWLVGLPCPHPLDGKVDQAISPTKFVGTFRLGDLTLGTTEG